MLVGEPPRVCRRPHQLEDGVMNKVRKYSTETRERAVRLVWDAEREHASQWAAICFHFGEGGLHG